MANEATPDTPAAATPNPSDSAPTEQPAAPAAGASAPAPAEQPAADAPADGQASDQPQETVEELRAKFQDTELKRRDTQSRADRAEARVKELEEGTGQSLSKLDRDWRAYIERNAPELYEKLTGAERSRDEATTTSAASAASSLAVINRIYRDGDSQFAQFLETLQEDGVKITTQSLSKHRETFNRLRGPASGSGNLNGAPAPVAASATPAPPRIPSGGRPTVEAAPAWKPGEPFKSRDLMTRGLKEARDRRAPAPARRAS